jgi:hypothetical protein
MSPSVPAFQLPLADGFNPQHLPDVAPPVAGVRSWEWLADRSVDPAEKQAYLEQRRPAFGTVDPHERGLLVEPLPAAEVIASHLSQDIVCALGGAPPVSVRFSAAAEPASNGVSPFSVPVAVIGTVAPARDAVAALGRRFGEELTAHLAGLGLRSRTAIAVDVARRWSEPVVITDYSREFLVRSAAQLHLQPYYSVWRVDESRTVIEAVEAATGDVVGRGFGRLGKVGTRTCPLIPGSQCGDLCKTNGGPWTSASIHAMARWEKKRARMLTALGCDTCGDGSITVFVGKVWPGGRWTVSVAPEPGLQSRHDRLVAPPEAPA